MPLASRRARSETGETCREAPVEPRDGDGLPEPCYCTTSVPTMPGMDRAVIRERAGGAHRQRRAGGARADRAGVEARGVLRRVVRGRVVVLPRDGLSDAHRRGIRRVRLAAAIANHRDGDVGGDGRRGRTRAAATCRARAKTAPARSARLSKRETNIPDLRKMNPGSHLLASAVPGRNRKNGAGNRAKFAGPRPDAASTIRVSGYVMRWMARANAWADGGSCSRYRLGSTSSTSIRTNRSAVTTTSTRA